MPVYQLLEGFFEGDWVVIAFYEIRGGYIKGQ